MADSGSSAVQWTSAFQSGGLVTATPTAPTEQMKVVVRLLERYAKLGNQQWNDLLSGHFNVMVFVLC